MIGLLLSVSSATATALAVVAAVAIDLRVRVWSHEQLAIRRIRSSSVARRFRGRDGWMERFRAHAHGRSPDINSGDVETDEQLRGAPRVRHGDRLS